MVRDAALKALEDGISDPSRLKQAQDIYNKCHDEGNWYYCRLRENNFCNYIINIILNSILITADTNKVTGHDQALKICTCFIPSLGLLDKLWKS